jgi:hypothetical protein
MPTITESLTMAQLEALKPKTLWVSRVLKWWTHRSESLHKARGGKLSDPIGGDVYVVSDVKDYLRRAKLSAKEGVYGKHGIAALMAAHSDNCDTGFQFWNEYGALIDEQNKRKPKVVHTAANPGLVSIVKGVVKHEANFRIGRKAANGDGPSAGEETE